MKRRSFLKTGVGLVIAGLLPQRARADTELRLLTWEGYADDRWVKDFEADNGVTVSKTYVGSNDEYMAKLAAGGSDYDLVVIVSSLAKRAIDAGFVEELRPEKIPNIKQLYPRLQSLEFLSSGGKLYGVPTFIAVSPVTVDADVIPESEDFGILFDPKYSGKIALWDDVSTIGDVANWLGYENIWTLDDTQLEAVMAKLIEQKPLVRTYWSQAGEAMDLFKNKEIIATNSWSYITATLKTDGFNARDFYANPPLAALDSHFVVKGSKNSDLANKFINHIISAKSQGRIAEVSGYTPTNPGSKENMPSETWKNLRMEQMSSLINEIRFWEDIPRRARYIEIFNAVKSA
jgi:putative spermidine/putrescine transport system substrate-binding protein/spermidine/putrescine transport system substrate-binding protein